MRLALVILVVLGQQPPLPPSKPLQELRKKSVEELEKMRAAMQKKGMRAEAGDAECIARKLQEPQKMMQEKGGATPFPGETPYEEVLGAWTELGTQLSQIHAGAAAGLSGREKEEVELFAGWFATFPELARGVRHLNRRRKFSKLPPVTLDWSSSIGGFLHGRYLQLNSGRPETAGLNAHNEDRRLPGYSLEGEAAAGGILAGGGSAEGVMDMWLGSRFHRDPVFTASCGRIAFGGLPGGGWSCRDGGGTAGKPLSNVVTYPGDGDTEIQTAFGGELPNPFPPGMTSSGTLVVVEYTGAQPKKPRWMLVDPAGSEVETVTLDTSPICFVAKDPLKGKSLYSVVILGDGGYRFRFTFTTR